MMNNISLILTIFTILLALIIFIIQVRPVIKVNSRLEFQPFDKGDPHYNIIMYVDVHNEGLCPIKYKIKSESEKRDSQRPLNNPDNPIRVEIEGCSYQDIIRSELTLKNDNKPGGKWVKSYEKIHKLKSKASDYFVESNISISSQISANSWSEISSIGGETFVEVTPVGLLWNLPIVRHLNTRKQRIDFNNLFVDAISKTQTIK